MLKFGGMGRVKGNLNLSSSQGRLKNSHKGDHEWPLTIN